MLAPIGSSKSKTIFEPMPRQAMPMTSLTCTSRQARTQRLQWMQASRLTRIAGWLGSGATAGRHGSRLSVTSMRSAHCHSLESCWCATSRAGWSATSISITIRREARARSVAVCTTMPGAARRWHEAASTRSPSTSTMHARQLPSAR